MELNTRLRLLIGDKTSDGNAVVSLCVTFCFCAEQTATAEVFSLHTQKKKHVLVYLKEHVSRFYSSISSHSASFHDGADVNAAVSPVITLTDNTDAQEVIPL